MCVIHVGHVTGYPWRSADNFASLFPPFCGFWDLAQVVRHPYLLSCTSLSYGMTLNHWYLGNTRASLFHDYAPHKIKP